MSTMTLTEFLLARIAEDEADARAASTGHVWTWDDDHETLSSDAQTQFGRECIIDTEGANPPGPAPGAHIARWDPDRVLAECEAKRRIMEDATNQHTSCVELDWVVQVLASVYADHPDYREEWRP